MVTLLIVSVLTGCPVAEGHADLFASTGAQALD